MALIRKLNLADVITSTSTNMPPYRFINQLGVNVTCNISWGNSSDHAAIKIDLLKNSVVPINRQKLAAEIRRIGLLKNRQHSFPQGNHQSAYDDTEHRLGLHFQIGRETFTSKESITIGT